MWIAQQNEEGDEYDYSIFTSDTHRKVRNVLYQLRLDTIRGTDDAFLLVKTDKRDIPRPAKFTDIFIPKTGWERNWMDMDIDEQQTVEYTFHGQPQTMSITYLGDSYKLETQGQLVNMEWEAMLVLDETLQENGFDYGPVSPQLMSAFRHQQQPLDQTLLAPRM